MSPLGTDGLVPLLRHDWEALERIDELLEDLTDLMLFLSAVETAVLVALQLAHTVFVNLGEWVQLTS